MAGQIIDRQQFKKEYFESSHSSVAEFFRLYKGSAKVPNKSGNFVRQTSGRSEEKRLLKEEAVENTKQAIREVSKEERAKFLKQAKQYYIANSKSILKIAREHYDGIKKIPVRDLKMINDEIRIILGIPNTISSNTHKLSEADEVDDFMSKLLGDGGDDLGDIETKNAL